MRSIDEILRSAWREINIDHRVALESVRFETIRLTDGNVCLAASKVDGYPVPSEKEDKT